MRSPVFSLFPQLPPGCSRRCPGYRLSARLNVLAALLTFLTAVSLFVVEPSSGSYLLVDDLNKVFIVLTTFVGFTTSVFSASYIGHEIEIGRLTPAFVRFYHAMYQVLMFAMNLALVANNIGLMWVAIEMATLTTVLMVGIYRTHEALEAAWKYFILGSVGIALALFGTILVYMAARPVIGEGLEAMVWTILVQHAAKFDPALLNVAFIFLAARLWHQSGPCTVARLVARRARRRSDPDLGSVVRPAAQCRALCAIAIQDAARAQSGGDRTRPTHGDHGPGFLPVRRFHAVPAPRHQTHVRLFLDRAHGHHRVRLRHGWCTRQFRRSAAHDHAFAHQVGDILCGRPHRAGQGDTEDRRHGRINRDQPCARLGFGARCGCDCRPATARHLHERIPGSEFDFCARAMAGDHSGAWHSGRAWRPVPAPQYNCFWRAARADRTAEASYVPMFAHLAIVFMAGIYMPPALVDGFQNVARLLG